MSSSRHIAFLTGTRADYGKIKPLILAAHENGFRVSVFATGMHLLPQFGRTIKEVRRTLPKDITIVPFKNQVENDTMDVVVAKTITGLSAFLTKMQPDLIAIHGDRPEALAGAITGALRNTRVVHIEGGELSGTIDGIIRHAVSKMSHVHLVANDEARARLIQLGEASASIHVIGSPDLDIMMSPALPTLRKARARYKIDFDEYQVAIFHPVTTDLDASKHAAKEFVAALIESGRNYVVIHPNNDTGHEHILREYELLREIPQRFRIFESLRFEYFLTLLRNAQALVGNSSAGIREAPIYGVPSVDVGDRQRGRYDGPSIFPCPPNRAEIKAALDSAVAAPREPQLGSFGDGRSSEHFVQLLKTGQLFDAPVDKVFVDLKYVM